MASSKSLVVFALAMAMTVAATSAQNTPQDFVHLHNQARAANGVGPVTWDTNVAKYAQDYAEECASDCRLQHSHGPYGENIFWASGEPASAADAMEMWVNEKRYYHYDTNSCEPGMVCGHYTQVVWRETKRIGCSRVVCDADRGVLIICNYDPPGNMNGERPFLTLDAAAK